MTAFGSSLQWLSAKSAVSKNIQLVESYYRKLWIRCGNERGGVPFRVDHANPGGSRVEGDATDAEGNGKGALREASRELFHARSLRTSPENASNLRLGGGASEIRTCGDLAGFDDRIRPEFGALFRPEKSIHAGESLFARNSLFFASGGRRSITLEKLLRALLLQVLYTVSAADKSCVCESQPPAALSSVRAK
jgi:hypothetical protein